LLHSVLAFVAGCAITLLVAIGLYAAAIASGQRYQYVGDMTVWATTGFKYEIWPVEAFESANGFVPGCPPGTGPSVVVTRLSVGWPLTVLQRDLAYPDDPPLPPGRLRMHASWMLPGAFVTNLRKFRVIWPNLLGMGVVSGAIAWGVLSGSRKLIAIVRSNRASRIGKCPVCRYDLSGLAGSICPECGHGHN
jgi:hypothetical protein